MIVGVIVPVIIITFVNISLRPSLMLSKNLLYPCHIQRLSFTSHYLNCPLFCDLNWLLLTNQKLIKSETHQIRNSPNQKLTKLEHLQTGKLPDWILTSQVCLFPHLFFIISHWYTTALGVGTLCWKVHLLSFVSNISALFDWSFLL